MRTYHYHELDDEDDLSKIMKNGDRFRVPMMMADADTLQRTVTHTGFVHDARPGGPYVIDGRARTPLTQDAAEQARDAWIKDMATAWQRPVVADARHTHRVVQYDPQGRVASTYEHEHAFDPDDDEARDSQPTTNDAYQQYCVNLTDAWRRSCP